MQIVGVIAGKADMMADTSIGARLHFNQYIH